MSDKKITATLLRRQLHEALQTAESRAGRVLITRHGKVVAALVSADDLARLERGRELWEAQEATRITTDDLEVAIKVLDPEPIPEPVAPVEVPKTKLILDL